MQVAVKILSAAAIPKGFCLLFMRVLNKSEFFVYQIYLLTVYELFKFLMPVYLYDRK